MMTTSDNFFDFWARAIASVSASAGTQVHPDDRVTLATNSHEFVLDALIGPWMGPLRTAPVVLLTLNGGIGDGGEVERREASFPDARAWMAKNLEGNSSLPSFATNPGGRRWTEGKLAQFGLSYESAASKVSFVNLIAYRSKNGAKDMRMADRLPSSLMLKSWMRDTLFPEAEAGRRIVVCLRSARPWGLDPETPTRGESLFVPKFNRQAIMCYGHDGGAMRDKIGAAVRRAVFS
jgi:hypothetical protein